MRNRHSAALRRDAPDVNGPRLLASKRISKIPCHDSDQSVYHPHEARTPRKMLTGEPRTSDRLPMSHHTSVPETWFTRSPDLQRTPGERNPMGFHPPGYEADACGDGRVCPATGTESARDGVIDEMRAHHPVGACGSIARHRTYGSRGRRRNRVRNRLLVIDVAERMLRRWRVTWHRKCVPRCVDDTVPGVVYP